MGGYAQVVEEGPDRWCEAERPPMDPEITRIACCDCGLVHDFRFSVRGKRVQFRLRRNNRATGQVRRGMVRRREGIFAATGTLLRVVREMLETSCRGSSE